MSGRRAACCPTRSSRPRWTGCAPTLAVTEVILTGGRPAAAVAAPAGRPAGCAGRHSPCRTPCASTPACPWPTPERLHGPGCRRAGAGEAALARGARQSRAGADGGRPLAALRAVVRARALCCSGQSVLLRGVNDSPPTRWRRCSAPCWPRGSSPTTCTSWTRRRAHARFHVPLAEGLALLAGAARPGDRAGLADLRAGHPGRRTARCRSGRSYLEGDTVRDPSGRLHALAAHGLVRAG